MLRPEPALVTNPKLPLMMLVLGLPKFGWLNALKISHRNCSRAVPRARNFGDHNVPDLARARSAHTARISVEPPPGFGQDERAGIEDRLLALYESRMELESRFPSPMRTGCPLNWLVLAGSVPEKCRVQARASEHRSDAGNLPAPDQQSGPREDSSALLPRPNGNS